MQIHGTALKGNFKYCAAEILLDSTLLPLCVSTGQPLPLQSNSWFCWFTVWDWCVLLVWFLMRAVDGNERASTNGVPHGDSARWKRERICLCSLPDSASRTYSNALRSSYWVHLLNTITEWSCFFLSFSLLSTNKLGCEILICDI